MEKWLESKFEIIRLKRYYLLDGAAAVFVKFVIIEVLVIAFDFIIITDI